MNKKILSLVLALVMVLGTFTSVFAETKTTEAKKDEAKVEKIEKVVGKQNKIDYIKDLKIVEGFEDGDLKLDSNITRSQITKVLVIGNGDEDLAKKLQGLSGLYSDLKTDHWANGYVAVGTTTTSKVNNVAMLNGYPDGTFKPENDVTYAELAKMLVVLAKNDLTKEMADNAVWASSWINWAIDLGIFEDVNVTDYNAKANRADAFTMLYNALYRMKEFKRVPANETRGIISNFTKDVLQLNQDAKAEYKITADSVFVTGYNSSRVQIQQIKNLDKKIADYYLGSLVRVLVNDKNEVTHIIELGNPADLANGILAGQAAKNDIWRGVSDNTVETVRKGGANVTTAEEASKRINKATEAYATIQFKSNDIKAKSITFNNVKDVKNNKHDLVLNINDKTEFYVANPANNIMRKVANVNEALSLIGFKDYKDYAIADVYAGFDSSNLKNDYQAIRFDRDHKHDAKVVVFNLVNKTYEGTKYRVIESSSSNFRTTLEKTDGTLLDRNNVYDTARFPLEYGDKLDIITLDDFRNGSIYNTVLDHSDTTVYPIVKIVDVDKDKSIIVEDKNGERTFLDIRDADIFSAQRYGKLEVGTSIQFKVENHNTKDANNVATDISLLDKAELKGSLVGVLPSVDAHQQLGTIVEVNDVDGTHPTIVVKTHYNLFNANDKNGYQTYNVSKDNARALVRYEGTKQQIAFKVFNELGWGGNHYAADFRLNNEEGTKITDIKTSTIFEKYLADIEKLTPANRVNYNNLADVKEELRLLDLVTLSNSDQFKFENEYQAYEEKLTDTKDIVAQYDELKAQFDMLSNGLFRNIDKTTLTPAAVENNVKSRVNSVVDTNKYDVKVELNDPKEAPDYKAEEKLNIKITLTLKSDHSITGTEAYEGNIVK